VSAFKANNRIFSNTKFGQLSLKVTNFATEPDN